MEKVIKDNAWNRVFRRKKVENQKRTYNKMKSLNGFSSEILTEVNQAKVLTDLLDIHKKAWKLGFRNENLNVCPYGMFRADKVEDLNVDNVFLGDIWGLWTNTIRFWNTHSDETMAGNGFGIDPETKVYDLIMSQYRTLLRKNFTQIQIEARTYVLQYEKINKPKDPFKLY